MTPVFVNAAKNAVGLVHDFGLNFRVDFVLGSGVSGRFVQILLARNALQLIFRRLIRLHL